MAELPLELLEEIAKDVEGHPAIFTLRLVSRRLKSAVTALAFRVIVLNDHARSAEAVSFLQDCDESVTSLVRELLFKGDPDNYYWRGETSGKVRRDAVKTVFSRLVKFPNLQKLQFDFHNNYEEDLTYDGLGFMTVYNPTHFLLLQNEIFATLAANPPPPLTSITLNNVIAIPDDIYAQEDFHKIFQASKQLGISVLSDAGDSCSYWHDPLVKFWNQSVPHMVRSATAVTALTIRSDQAVGTCPALSFKDTFLPHLTSLALHRFALDPEFPAEDVVEWILRHKATLTRLELRRCSIDGGEAGNFPRPWHAVLALFEAELGALRDFLFNPDRRWTYDGMLRDPRFEYTRLYESGYTEEEEEVPGEALDLPALESLMTVVNSRTR